ASISCSDELEGDQTVTAHGTQVAGEVDPALATPVGDQPVELGHVLVGDLLGDRAGTDGRGAQGAGAQRLGELGQGVGGQASTAHCSGGIGQGAVGQPVEQLHVGAEQVGGAGQRGGHARPQL